MSVHSHISKAEHHADEADGYADKVALILEDGVEIENGAHKACEMHRRLSHLHLEIARTKMELSSYIKTHKQNPST